MLLVYRARFGKHLKNNNLNYSEKNFNPDRKIYIGAICRRFDFTRLFNLRNCEYENCSVFFPRREQ